MNLWPVNHKSSDFICVECYNGKGNVYDIEVYNFVTLYLEKELFVIRLSEIINFNENTRNAAYSESSHLNEENFLVRTISELYVSV